MSANKRGSGMYSYFNAGLFGAGTDYSNTPAVQRERNIHAMLERNIAELAVNRFAWKNLPDSIDARFVEVSLLTNGMVVWYWDEGFDKLLAVKASSSGYVNFQDQPTSFTVIGPGSRINGLELSGKSYMSKTIGAYIPSVHADKPNRDRRGIPMWPNYFRQPELDIIGIYASRLATIERTLEINSKNARRTKILKTTADTQLSTINANRQIDEGIEAIQVTGALRDTDFVEALDLGILPDQYDKLSILRTRWWNECMGLLGIDNANQDKKERLVAAEVGANDSQTDSMRFVNLNARRQALEQINEVFKDKLDAPIEVDFNVEVEAKAQQMAAMNGIGGDNNGDVHDGAK